MPDFSPSDRPAAPWSLTPVDAAHAVGVDPARGLSAAESRARLEEFGPNQLQEEAVRGLAAIFQASACSRPPDPKRRMRMGGG